MDSGPRSSYSGTLEANGQHANEAAEFNTANLKKKRASRKRKWGRTSSSLPQGNIVGVRFSHNWREEDGLITQWKGTILHQVPVNPSLFLVKYDGLDCVCGVELQKDKRISALKFLPEVIQAAEVPDPILADALIGKAVEHTFEGEDGSKAEWRGKVLAQVPILNAAWFYITYERDPLLFIYQLLDDWKKGDLRIVQDLSNDPEPDENLELSHDLIGQDVEYANGDGPHRLGKVIYQIEGRPTMHFVKFDDDVHIFAYNPMENN